MANKKGNGTAGMVWEIAEPIAKDLGLKLWDVRYVKEGAQWYLRVIIDKEDGVGIEDCEKMSRALDTPLDEKEIGQNQYILEVSSPGIERELVREEHFQQFIGADVMVKMIRPIEGIGKEFKGKLKDADKQTVTITDHSDENEITINKKDTVYIKLDDFDF